MSDAPPPTPGPPPQPRTVARLSPGAVSPPRLARLADRTAELAVYRLAGPNALAVAEAAGLPVPTGPGRVLAAPGGTSEVARATEGAPFTLQLTTPMAETEVLSARLGAAG